MPRGSQTRPAEQPSGLEPRDALRANTARVGAWVIAVGTVVWLLAGHWIIEIPVFEQQLVAVGLVASLLVLGLLRAGRVTAASWLLALTIWSLTTGAVLRSAAAPGRYFIGYILSVVLAGMLVGPRAAFLASAGGLLALASAGLVPLGEGRELPEGGLLTWFSMVVGFMTITALVIYFRDRIDWALDSMEARGRELAERNRELEASRERFRVLTESSPDLIAETDERGRFLYASPNYSEVLGYAPEELIGERVLELLDEASREQVLRPAVRAALDRGLHRQTFLARHRDGTPRWLETSGRTFRAVDGTLHTVWVSRDVTNRRALEEQLERSQRLEAVGRLAGGIAHDFNNLLGVIYGYGEMLLERSGDDPEIQEYAQEITNAAERAEVLTQQLLAFARRKPLRPVVVDVTRSLRAMENMLERVLGEHVELETHFADEPLRVRIEPANLEQIAVNLALNARDAMPRGGHLWIDARVEKSPEGDEWVLLAIQDDGTGIDPSVAPRVFDPFFTTKGPGAGTGLGLSTVHGVVEQSGGRITLAPRVGGGSRFEIRLPRVHEEPEEEKAAQGAQPPLGRGAVLVVEDDDAVRTLVERTLRGHGYTVHCARSGDEALALVQSSGLRPRLLLSDVVMPRMGGPELYEALREIQPGLRVLFMSGYAENPSGGGRAVPAEAPLIPKPFAPRDLAARVHALLEG